MQDCKHNTGNPCYGNKSLPLKKEQIQSDDSGRQQGASFQALLINSSFNGKYFNNGDNSAIYLQSQKMFVCLFLKKDALIMIFSVILSCDSINTTPQ